MATHRFGAAEYAGDRLSSGVGSLLLLSFFFLFFFFFLGVVRSPACLPACLRSLPLIVIIVASSRWFPCLAVDLCDGGSKQHSWRLQRSCHDSFVLVRPAAHAYERSRSRSRR